MNPIVFLCVLGAAVAAPLDVAKVGLNAKFGGIDAGIPLVYEIPARNIVLGEELKVNSFFGYHGADEARNNFYKRLFYVNQPVHHHHHEIPEFSKSVPLVHSYGNNFVSYKGVPAEYVERSSPVYSELYDTQPVYKIADFPVAYKNYFYNTVEPHNFVRVASYFPTNAGSESYKLAGYYPIAPTTYTTEVAAGRYV